MNELGAYARRRLELGTAEPDETPIRTALGLYLPDATALTGLDWHPITPEPPAPERRPAGFRR